MFNGIFYCIFMCCVSICFCFEIGRIVLWNITHPLVTFRRVFQFIRDFVYYYAYGGKVVHINVQLGSTRMTMTGYGVYSIYASDILESLNDLDGYVMLGQTMMQCDDKLFFVGKG